MGDLLDKRDKMIRDRLTNVSDKTDEIERLEREADEILRKARAEAQAAINQVHNFEQMYLMLCFCSRLEKKMKQ